MKYVALSGSIREGLLVTGPFSSKADADKYMEADRKDNPVVVGELNWGRVEDNLDWHEDPHVVLSGNPLTGFKVFGPFNSDDEATDFGERFTTREFQTMPLAIPCPKCGNRTYGTQGGHDAVIRDGHYMCTTCDFREFGGFVDVLVNGEGNG